MSGPGARSAVVVLLRRGLVVGALAGLLAGAVGFALGEPEIERAIVMEERAAASAAPAPAESGPVGRGGQRAGLFLATALYGTAVGGLFGLFYGVARGRVGPRREGPLALVLAGGLFVAGALVPFLKYPANPPAVGDPETIAARTVLHVIMVAISLLSLVAGSRVARRLPSRPGWLRPAGGAATFLATVAIAFLVLPSGSEAPRGFPAELLWDFRLASLAVQLTLWGSLGALFAVATERARGR